MRKSRFNEEQIRLAVQQAEAGLDLTEICRKYGVGQLANLSVSEPLPG